MYEPSRLVVAFHVAGFQYWDGALVLGDLEVGDELELVPEPDNPHDASAVALSYNGSKLGYVPRDDNELISLLCFYGHEDILEVRVQQVDPEADPWKQVRVGIYLRDGR